MYDVDSITPETQVLLLLCGSLGRSRDGETKPLTPLEYYLLAQWMKNSDLNPADLVTPEGLRMVQDMLSPKLDSGRIIALLERGGALALSLEDWCGKGIWVMSRYDEKYPKRLADNLGKSAPLLLYGVGNMNLMSEGGLAVVGSRDVDDEGLEFTRRIAKRCAEEGITVISGAARGVDSEAMLAALEADGQVVGVVADSLVKTAVSGKFRQGIIDENLVLVSPYDPYAGFSIGNAMGRNKYIYGLSDWALVISSSVDTGGTWSGAVENLKSKWAPLFVRDGEGVPEGNRALISQGGIPISSDILDNAGILREWLSSQADLQDKSAPANSQGQLSLLD